MLLKIETCFYIRILIIFILGVFENETCYKMGHIRTRDFTVNKILDILDVLDCATQVWLY